MTKLLKVSGYQLLLNHRKHGNTFCLSPFHKISTSNLTMVFTATTDTRFDARLTRVCISLDKHTVKACIRVTVKACIRVTVKACIRVTADLEIIG